jgi:hypothetical protein
MTSCTTDSRDAFTRMYPLDLSNENKDFNGTASFSTNSKGYNGDEGSGILLTIRQNPFTAFRAEKINSPTSTSRLHEQVTVNSRQVSHEDEETEEGDMLLRSPCGDPDGMRDVLENDGNEVSTTRTVGNRDNAETAGLLVGSPPG